MWHLGTLEASEEIRTGQVWGEGQNTRKNREENEGTNNPPWAPASQSLAVTRPQRCQERKPPSHWWRPQCSAQAPRASRWAPVSARGTDRLSTAPATEESAW